VSCLYTTQHKWRIVLVVFVTSGRPSFITFERRSRWTDFRESCYWILLRKSVEKQLIWLKSDHNIGHSAWRPKYVLCSLQHFVVGQQRKGSRMSRCHGSIERIYIADSCRLVKSDTEETYCCVSLATFSGFILLTATSATCRSRAKHRECIVAFPWQQWLRERAAVSRCTYITCIVSPTVIAEALNVNVRTCVAVWFSCVPKSPILYL
jgi:hypothetical protein